MVRLIAAGAGVLLLGSCDSSIGVSVGSPSASNAGQDTPAANLRVHTDLLFGEHVFFVAKLAVAAAAGRKDEYHSYASLLAINGGDVAALYRNTLGETEGTQFGDAWADQDDDLVGYLVAGVTHDQAASDAAAAKLTGTYVPLMSGVLASSLSIALDEATRQTTGQVAALKAIIDDAVAGGYAKLYADIVAAHAHDVAFADAIAMQAAHRFPDRLPGDPSIGAAEFRAGFNSLMQRQSYLTTMATDAAAAGSADELGAATAQLSSNVASLSTLYGGRYGQAAGEQLAGLWNQQDSALVAGAKGGSPAPQPDGSALGAALTGAFDALAPVVADQRSKTFLRVAADDRAAAFLAATAADELHG